MLVLLFLLLLLMLLLLMLLKHFTGEDDDRQDQDMHCDCGDRYCPYNQHNPYSNKKNKRGRHKGKGQRRPLMHGHSGHPHGYGHNMHHAYPHMHGGMYPPPPPPIIVMGPGGGVNPAMNPLAATYGFNSGLKGMQNLQNMQANMNDMNMNMQADAQNMMGDNNMRESQNLRLGYQGASSSKKNKNFTKVNHGEHDNKGADGITHGDIKRLTDSVSALAQVIVQQNVNMPNHQPPSSATSAAAASNVPRLGLLSDDSID